MEIVVGVTPRPLCVSGERREPGYPLGRRLGVLWCAVVKPGTHMRILLRLNSVTLFTGYDVPVRSTKHSVHCREPADSVGCSIEIPPLFG